MADTTFEIMMNAKKKGAAANTQAAWYDYQQRLQDEATRAEKASFYGKLGGTAGSVIASKVLPMLLASTVGGPATIAGFLVNAVLGASGTAGGSALGDVAARGFLPKGERSKKIGGVGGLERKTGYGRKQWADALGATTRDYNLEKGEKEAELDMSNKMTILSSLLSGLNIAGDISKTAKAFQGGELVDEAGKSIYGPKGVWRTEEFGEAAEEALDETLIDFAHEKGLPGGAVEKIQQMNPKELANVMMRDPKPLFGATGAKGFNLGKLLPRDVIMGELAPFDWSDIWGQQQQQILSKIIGGTR